MSRLPRLCPPGIAQHVIQRGNNRQVCFASKQDFAFYINCLHEAALLNCVDIHAWVLMTNHVHLLVTPQIKDGIALMMQAIGRKYVKYFNCTYDRSGTLWEGRYKSCLVASDNYLLCCYRYIEMNPVRAKLVSEPAKYHWSSYQCNALGKHSDLITLHGNYLNLGDTQKERSVKYQNLFKDAIGCELLTEIRESTNKNMAIGSERFKDEIEACHQRRVKSKLPGRPGKKKEIFIKETCSDPNLERKKCRLN
jgi:putative transposase